MHVDRRSFLVMGSAALLAACGSESSSGSGTKPPGNDDPTTTGSPTADVADGFVIARRFPDSSLTPGSLRLPVSLASTDQTLFRSGPDALTGNVLDEAGSQVASFTAPFHGTDLVIPYWSIKVQVDQAGLYFLQIDGAIGDPSAFQVFDPADVAIPTLGSNLPPFDTPTTTDARGVDPICTLDPPCPFHEMTLTEALASDLPVIYLVGTPAHCQTGTCGPGLQFLVEAAKGYTGRAAFVHAEVYTDNTATATALAVETLRLDYEPVVFFTDDTGLIVDRLDAVWDADELTEVLTNVVGPVS